MILSEIEQSIKNKIEKYGTPLKDWNVCINRGILTGYNEAFIINDTKRKELIATDPKSAEIIRPILRGRDIKRYGYEFANLYLINTHNGIKNKNLPPVDVNDYPAIKAHLDRYYQKLKERQDKGVTPYNLRNCIYMDDFNKQKIIYSETNNVNETKIAYDTKGFFTDKTCFIITSKEHNINDIYKVLSSEIFTWYMKHKSPLLGTVGISLTKDLVETFPCVKYNGESIQISYKLTDCEMNYLRNQLKNN